jgi:hypothetical protein
MTVAEKKAKELIKKQTLENLLIQWELTSVCNDKHIPTVRGWLMDEFAERNPEAFEKWIDEDANDETLRNYMM